jgi:hypothetical protein
MLIQEEAVQDLKAVQLVKTVNIVNIVLKKEVLVVFANNQCK